MIVDMYGVATHKLIHDSRCAGRRVDGSVQQSSDVVDVRWGHDMHGATTRKLINESHSQ